MQHRVSGIEFINSKIHVFSYHIFAALLEILAKSMNYTEITVLVNSLLHLINELLKMHINCYSAHLFLEIFS